MTFVRKNTYYKTKGIFEKVVNKPILLKFKGDKPSVAIYNNRYYIQMPETDNNPVAETDIENYRSFEHELSHIVFSSAALDNIYSSVIKQLPRGIPENVVRDVINIVEDHRVDSLWNKLYPGSAKIRKQQLAKACERLYGNNITDPVLALYAVHANREDLITPNLSELATYFKDKLRMVEGASVKATIAVSVLVINQIIKFVKDLTQTPDQQAPQVLQTQAAQGGQGSAESTQESHGTSTHEPDSQDENKPKPDLTSTTEDTTVSNKSGSDDELSQDTDDISGNDTENDTTDDTSDLPDTGSLDNDKPDATDTQTDINTTETGTDTDNETSKTLSDIIDEIADNLDNRVDLSGLFSSNIPHDVVTNRDPYQQEPEIDINASIHDILDEARDEAEKEVEEIKSKIAEIDLKPPDPESNVFINVETTDECHYYNTPIYAGDQQTSVKIAKLLSRLKHKTIQINAEEGTDIDIDQYIQHKINKNITDVFVDDHCAEGITVIILLDISGSMIGSEINMAAKSTLILWDALERIKNVDFEVYTYCSHSNGKTLTITKETRSSITRLKPFGTTPTDKAIRYVTNVISYKPGKKFIILITDGVPEYGGYSFETLASWTLQQIKYARKKGIDVFTFFIGSKLSHETMKKIYGPEYTWEIVEKPEDIPKKLINFVLNKIIKTLSY